MAEIAPLCPLRYDLARLKGALESVVAPPYDVISPDERTALAARSPFNVVHLILPEGEGDAKYAHAGERLARWRSDGVLVRDEEPAFYRYDQTFVPPGQGVGAKAIKRRGFLALVRLVPFADRIVLPHERTLSGPKEDRLKLFRATRANLSPGFMLYRDARRELDHALETGEPLAEFATPDGIRHQIAKVAKGAAVRAIVEGIKRSTLLIADGHHRYETALRYSQEVGGTESGGRGEHRYFMTFLANGDDPNLMVFPTHRHVHSLPSFSFDTVIQGVRGLFEVTELPRDSQADAIVDQLRTAGRSSPSLAVADAGGRTAILSLRHDADLEAHPTLGAKPAALRRTDVSLLHAGILEGVLHITPEAQAAKTNLWYPQDASEALGALRAGRGQALFLMNATPVAQVREVAEAGEVMPQKSTFFYPKVLTGLAIHTLEPGRQVGSV